MQHLQDKKKNDKKPKVSIGKAFKTIIWPRRNLVFIGLVLIVIKSLAGLILPWQSKILLDEVVPNKDFDQLKRSLSHSDDNSTEDTSPTFKMMEDGSETMSREETAQLASRQEKFIISLENALLRIRNKTYGLCRVTGKLISKERLKLVPHATLSIEAKNMQ